MALFYWTIPLMIVAALVAVLPVLVGSIRDHRAVTSGTRQTQESAAVEAEYWHRMLGRRTTGSALTGDPYRAADAGRTGSSLAA